MIFKFLPVLILLFVFHLFLLNKTTFTAWPEMFSYPYLINNGYLIYKDFAHPYEPILSYFLSLVYRIFGYGLTTHQVTVWSIIIFNDILIFFISLKKLKNEQVLVEFHNEQVFSFVNNFLVFLPLFLFIIIQPFFDGNMLWFDLGATPFIILGTVILISFNNKKSFFWTGVFWGIALFIKQQVGILIIFFLIFLFLTKQLRHKIPDFLKGMAIPTLLIFLVLTIQGALKQFLFWTLIFPLYWLPKFPGYSQMPTIQQVLIVSFLFGPIILWLIKNFNKLQTHIRMILVILIATLLMTLPRFSYFHLQPAIAIFAILIAVLLKDYKKRAYIAIVPLLLVAIFLILSYRPFIGVEKARFYDPEDLKLAKFIEMNSSKSEKVYLFGPYSLLYVLSDRLPPKPWIDNFNWYFEIPGIQESFIAGLEKKIIVFKSPSLSGNWFDPGTYQPKKVVNYLKSNFKKSGQNYQGIEVWTKK